MADETMTLEQVRDSLRDECGRVEKDRMRYAECAYQVPAWVLSDLADAIDSAIAERKVPDGWQLVPIVPTAEMVEAWASAHAPLVDGLSDDEANRLVALSDWGAMLAVAPKVTP